MLNGLIIAVSIGAAGWRVREGQLTTVDQGPVIEPHNALAGELALATGTRKRG